MRDEVSYGIGVIGILQIVFITLKLCNVISWSWFLVLLPTIISVGLIAILFLIFILLGFFIDRMG